MNTLTHHAHELMQRIASLSQGDQIALLVAALIAIPWLISMLLTLARISIGGFQSLSERRRNPLTRSLAKKPMPSGCDPFVEEVDRCTPARLLYVNRMENQI